MQVNAAFSNPVRCARRPAHPSSAVRGAGRAASPLSAAASGLPDASVAGALKAGRSRRAAARAGALHNPQERMHPARCWTDSSARRVLSDRPLSSSPGVQRSHVRPLPRKKHRDYRLVSRRRSRAVSESVLEQNAEHAPLLGRQVKRRAKGTPPDRPLLGSFGIGRPAVSIRHGASEGLTRLSANQKPCNSAKS